MPARRPDPAAHASLARATTVIMCGTLVTSLLGFARAFVVSRYFGARTGTDAFFAALVVPQIFYYALVGGAVSAVLIPTFSRMAARDDADLWLVVRSVLAAEAILGLLAVGALELLSDPLMRVVASGFQIKVHAGALPLSVRLVRVLLPTIVFSSASAVSLAVLYSLGRRAAASFAPSLYHLGVISAALVGAIRFGITALAVGAVAGAALQFAVQLPSLLRAGGGRRRKRNGRLPLVDFGHPAVRDLGRLYLPVAAGLVVLMLGQVAEINFRSHLPERGGLSTMQYALQITQFPAGIAAASLGFAVLPAISRQAAGEHLAGYAHSVSRGLRLTLLAMVPAAVCVLTLSQPVAALLFQRGPFTAHDTAQTALALVGYAPQLVLVTVNQLLVFAFYARNDTRTPAAAGFAAVFAYVLLALLLARFTVLGLALAHSLSAGVQMLLLFTFLLRSLRPADRAVLAGRELAGALLKLGTAGGAMAVTASFVRRSFIATQSGVGSRLSAVVVPAVLSLLIYGGALLLLHPGALRRASSLPYPSRLRWQRAVDR